MKKKTNNINLTIFTEAPPILTIPLFLVSTLILGDTTILLLPYLS
jgi:hypothetical protein